MKLNKIFAACMLIAAVVLTACEPPVLPTPPGPGPNGQDTTVVTPPTPEGEAPDTTGWNIPAGALTVAQAREICAGLTTGDSTSTVEYYVMGWVKKVKEVNVQYGNASFFVEDVKGANSYDDFTAYRVKGLGGNKITNEAAVAEGDFVVIYGKLKNYKGTYENASGAYIWKSTNTLLAGGGNSGNTGTTPSAPDVPNVDIPAGAIVFDGDTDKGTATETQAAYEVSKDGITLKVSSGRLGTYNNETHYRIYKSQTLTITSTVGNIKEVVFTCTAKDDKEWGPGCFTWSTGDYTYSGANGTWTGSASEVVFTATTAQVRASQIAVVVE